MEGFLHNVGDYLWQQSWQLAVLVPATFLVSRALRNKSAHVRYLLWLIVLAKCLVPPVFSLPLALLPAKAFVPMEACPSEEVVGIKEVSREPGDAVSAMAQPVVLSPMRGIGQIAARHWPVTLWGTVALLFYLVNAVRALRIRKRLHSRRQPATCRIQEDLDSLCARHSPAARPRAWLLDQADQPFVWGWWQGEIYLPSRFSQDHRADHRQAILAHELSHVGRRDAGVNVLQLISQGLFWFHPLVWWANSQIRKEREKCCDEMVISLEGMAGEEYCQAILNTLTVTKPHRVPLASVAVAGSVKNIEERIKSIMKPNRTFRSRATIGSLVAILLLAGLAVPNAIAITRIEPLPDGVPFPNQPEVARRVLRLSLRRMIRLETRLLQYANDNDGRYPDTLNLLPGFNLEVGGLHGLGYLGRGRIMKTSPSAVIGYDMSFLNHGKGTYVLFGDHRVDYVGQLGLAGLGIAMPREFLAEVLLLYAPENSRMVQEFAADNGIQGSSPFTLDVSLLDEFVRHVEGEKDCGRISAAFPRWFEGQGIQVLTGKQEPSESDSPYILEGSEIVLSSNTFDGVLTIEYKVDIHRKVTKKTRRTATVSGTLAAGADRAVLACMGTTSPGKDFFLILKVRVLDEPSR